MVPAENLSKQHYLPQGTGDGGFYGFNCGFMRSVHGYYYQNEANSMAEDESRTNGTLNEEGSSSNDQEQEERDKSWLQLSIGTQTQTQTQATRTYGKYDRNKHEQGDPTLDLLPGGGSQSQQARPLSHIFHMPEFRPPPPRHGALAPYFGRPFPVQSTDVAGPSSESKRTVLASNTKELSENQGWEDDSAVNNEVSGQQAETG
ncbi:hypothetical protein V6N13_042183 [Hibiscus sabdariffa]